MTSALTSTGWAAGMGAAIVLYLACLTWSQSREELLWLVVQTLVLMLFPWEHSPEVHRGENFLSGIPVETWVMLLLAVHALSLCANFRSSLSAAFLKKSNKAHLWLLVASLFGALSLSVAGMKESTVVLSFFSLVASHLRMLRCDPTPPQSVFDSKITWLLALGIALLLHLSLVQGVPYLDSFLSAAGVGMLALWAWHVMVLQEWMMDRRRETHRVEADLRERFDMQVQMERKEVQSEAARKRAQKMAGRQAEFLATMSHELRTPLACVVGLSRMLAANEEFGQALRKDMGTIERLSVQLLRTVDDGLAFVREDRVQSETSRRQVQMAHLLRDIKSLATWLSKQQRNDLRFIRVHTIPAQLYFDEQRVRQILINLISNAARYCQDGEIILGVVLREIKGQHVLVWLIEDTGRGMDEQEQRQFFEPFFKSRDSQGLGLGLALVKRLVREVNGEIKLKSEKGHGTRFQISIPVQIHVGRESTDLEDDSESHSHEDGLSSPMALLPHGDLEDLNLTKLKQLVRLGQLSEIERWLANAKNLQGLGPESHRLLSKIESAVKVVDLHEIQALIDQVDTPLSFI